ncbi:MAG: right-handed parallel beta-helix repeat-containing protein, partial [Phycisphaerae bacterium]
MSDRKLPMSMTLVFAICAGALVSHAQTVLYVDDDAPLSGDCGDWCTAYKYLQDALSAAQAGDEIRVAEGIYKPDEDEAHPDGTGDRSATFQLISGVALHGGYRGCPGGVCGAGDDPNERDIETHETILSGDLSGDDAPNESDCCHHHSGSGCDDAGCEALVCGLDPECCSVRWDAHCVSLAHSNCAGVCGGFGENSCHVATGSGTDATAVLDGFTVAAGNADPACTERCGGGMYNYNGSPTVANCTFDGNIAQFEHGTGWGGGMYNYYASNPIVTNCTFSGNLANAGGGMYNGATSNPTVTNCTFTGNEGTNGGGMKSSY